MLRSGSIIAALEYDSPPMNGNNAWGDDEGPRVIAFVVAGFAFVALICALFLLIHA
jgi:hypothetical protein